MKNKKNRYFIFTCFCNIYNDFAFFRDLCLCSVGLMVVNYLNFYFSKESLFIFERYFHWVWNCFSALEKTCGLTACIDFDKSLLCYIYFFFCVFVWLPSKKFVLSLSCSSLNIKHFKFWFVIYMTCGSLRV